MDTKGYYTLILIVSFSLIYFFRLKAGLKYHFLDGQRVKITSSLNQETILQGSKQIFKIKGISIKAPSLPEYHYGDRLVIVGTIKKRVINSFFNRFWLINPQITKIEADNKKGLLTGKIMVGLFVFRRHLEQVFARTLAEPQSSLLMGIFLGIQRSLPVKFYQALKNTGTLHIIVASGMNISLTSGILLTFLSRFIKRKIALFVSLVSILSYCLIAGMSPPIVRAGLMAAILYLANFSGRETSGLWMLLLTVGIMLVIKPFLLFDVGFQLSFTATAGLILMVPFWQELLEKKAPFLPEQIRGDLSETISAQIFTLPILAITFGRFNPLSVLPNLAVLFLIPYLMILGLLIGFSGLIFLPLAQFFSLIAYFPLVYFIEVIKFFGRFSWFNLEIQGLSWFFALGYYLTVFSFFSLFHANPGLCVVEKDKC